MESLQAILDLVASLQAQIAGIADIQASYAAELKAQFDAGVASVVVDPAKVFTQADIDAAVAAQKLADASVPASSTLIYSQADMDKSLSDLKASIKAELDKDIAGVEALLQ